MSTTFTHFCNRSFRSFRLIVWVFLIAVFSWEGQESARAQSFSPVAWPSSSAYRSLYLGSGTIRDPRIQDQSNGGATPQSYVNIASAVPDTTLPSASYSFDGSTIFFRFRLESSPTTYAGGAPGANGDPFYSAVWNVMIDVNADGWRDFAITVDGSSGTSGAPIDVIRVVYSTLKNTQTVDPAVSGVYTLGSVYCTETYTSGAFTGQLKQYDGSGNLVTSNVWPNGRYTTVFDFGTTRVSDVSTSSDHYILDFQVPISMLNATAYGGPQITSSTPIQMGIVTGQNPNEPFKKDFSYNGIFSSSTGAPFPGSNPTAFDSTVVVPEVLVKSISATSCPTVTLAANIQAPAKTENGVIVANNLSAMSFQYWYDSNANGLADDGGSWTLIGSGTPTQIGVYGTTWSTSSLPSGQYLVKATATDQYGVSTDSYTQTLSGYSQVKAIVNNSCGTATRPSLSMTASPTSISSTGSVGQRNVVYTISVANAGSSSVTLTSLKVVLPSGFSYRNDTTGGDLTPATSPTTGATDTVTWTFSSPSIGAGQTKTFKFNGTGGTTPGTFSCTVLGTGSATYTSATNVAAVTVTKPSATLAKSSSVAGAFTPGQSVTFTLAYANNGTADLSGVTIIDTLATGLTYGSSNPSGSYNSSNRVVTWSIGSVSAGTSGSVSVTVTVANPYTGATEIANAASLTSNELSAISSNRLKKTVSSALLSLSHTTTSTDVDPGNYISYTLTYGNPGNAAASGVTIVDTLPAGLTFVTGSSSPITPSVNGQILTWTIGALASLSENNVITYQASVTRPYPTVETNTTLSSTAYISSNENPASGSTASVSVTSARGGAISVSADQSFYVTTDSATITITLRNNGTVSSTLTTLRDSLPSGFTYGRTSGGTLSASTSPSSGSTGKITWTFSPSVTIAPDSIKTLIFRAKVSTSSGSFTNLARAIGTLVAASGTDSISATNTLVVEASGSSTTFRKTADKTTAAPGDTVTYTIFYKNISAGNQPTWAFYDTLSTSLAFVTGSATSINGKAVTSQTYTAVSRELKVEVANPMSQGDSTRFSFKVVVNSGTSGTSISNKGSAWNNTLTTSFGTTNTVSFSSQTLPAITLTKSVNSATAARNSTLQYTIIVSNGASGATSTNTTVLDTLPSNITYVQGSATKGGSFNSSIGSSGRLSWNIGTLATAASETLRFSATVSATANVNDQIINRAYFSNSEGTPKNSSATTTVAALPSLSLSKSVNKSSAGPGDTLVFTLSYSNNGTASATNVVIKDTLSSNLTYLSSTGSGSHSSSIVTWNVGTVSASASGSVTVTARVNSPIATNSISSVTNRASISSTEVASTSSGTSTTTVRYPSVSISKSVDSTQAVPGSTVTFTLIVSNSSVVSATSATVFDTLSSNLTYVANSTTRNGSSVSDNSGNSALLAGLSLGTLAAGGTDTIRFSATVNTPLANGLTIANTAYATNGRTTEKIASNGPSFNVRSSPTLSVAKSVSPTTGAPGDTLTYTITYGNTGTTDATSVNIQDAIPTNTTYVSNSVSGTGASYDIVENKIFISRTSIGAGVTGQTATFKVTVNAPLTSGSNNITNSASMTAANGSSTSGNTSATITASSTVSVLKSGPAYSTISGSPARDTITYVIAYNVSGNATTDSVYVNDELPSGLTYISSTLNGSSAGSVTGQTVKWNVGTANPVNSGTATVTAYTATPGNYSNTSSFTDRANPTGTNSNTTSTTITNPVTGVLTASATRLIGLSIAYSVDDADRKGEGFIFVTVENVNSGETEIVGLYETATNSGIFTGTLATSRGTSAGSNNDGFMNAQDDDTARVSYYDELDASMAPRTTTANTLLLSTGSPAQTTISASPDTIIANGTSTSTVTVQVKDSTGTNLTSGGDVVALSTTRGTLGSVTDNGNGTYTATLTSSTSAGLATITGTLNGDAITDNATVFMRPGPASGTTSLITASPDTIIANGTSTSTITVQLKDANGNNLTAGGDTVVLSTTRGTLGSVTDNGNGTYTATLTSSTTAGLGTITGTVNSSNITDNATVFMKPGPASGATSLITASPDTIIANGTSTSTVTVQLKDANGNNLTAGGDTVALSTTRGTLGSVTDNGNGTYTATLTSSTSTGLATVTGTVNSSNITDNATVYMKSGGASGATSLITASPDTIIANGTSTSTITVQLKDANGNNLTAGGDTVALSTTRGTLGSVTDNGNGTYTATLTSSTTAGLGTITGTVNSSNITDNATVFMKPGPASGATSLITASPDTIIANGTSTSTITVQLKDANGNNLTAGGDTVALSTTRGTLGSVTDNGNGTYTATLTSSTVSGLGTITGTVNSSNITDNATVFMKPGPASGATSLITASPDTIIANGTSTSTITVQLKDANGNNLTAGGDTVVLSTTRGTLGSVTDNGNGTYTATLTSSTVSGLGTITGTVNSSNITDNATVFMRPGPASGATSLITASPDTIIANGTSTSTITVQLKDADGNNLTAGGDTVALSTTRGTLGSVTDNGNGTYTATLTSSTTAGLGTITGTVNSSNITDNATVFMKPGPASGATSLITASPDTIIANGTSTSTVTVQLKDANGNNLTAGGDTVALSTTRGTLGSVTDNGNGTYTATLTSSTSSGLATVTGTVNSSNITDDATVFMGNDGASGATSLITASPDTIIANGTSTSTITVQLKDANGNNLTAGGDTVVLSTTRGTLGSVTDNGNGTYTATLTSSTTAGLGTITGTVNSSNITDNATVFMKPGPASGATSLITASPDTIIANGTSTSTITVQLKDANGNNLTAGGDTVVLSTTRGTLGSVTDNGNGTYTATLTSSTVSGLGTITGTVNSSNITDNATVFMKPGPASGATSLITASPDTIIANGTSTSTITVQLKDANGNNLTAGGDTVALSTTRGTLGSVTDNGNGTYTATLTSSTVSGLGTVTGTVNSSNITDNATVFMRPGPASGATSLITASPDTIIANGTSTSTVTVQLKDANGNNLTAGGDTVVLSTTRGTLGSVTDNGNGTYSATLTSTTTPGLATISGTVNGANITDTATVYMRVGPASLSQSTISASPDSIEADGVTTSTVTVQLKDANGNNLTSSGGTVALSTNRGTLGSVTDNNDGTYTATLTSSTSIGLATITGSLDSNPLTDNATVQFVSTGASPLTTTISASPDTIIANGTSTSTVTVQAKDMNGTNLTVGGDTVVLSTTRGSLSSVTDNGDGTYTATLTSSTSSGLATITGTINGVSISDNASVFFKPGAASGSTSLISASPDTIVANGTSTSTITVQLKDVNGNNLITGGDTVALSTDRGTLGSVTDNGNGTYTASLTSSTTTGLATITGTVNSGAITDNATVFFKPGAASPTTTLITASQDTIVANGTSTSVVTVQLKDANGNNLTSSGGTVVLSTDRGTLGSVTDNGDGTYTATLTSSTTAGLATITGTLNGNAINDNATVLFVPGPASTATSTISASPASITANGTSTSTVTVQLKDVNGNNLTASGGTVALSSTKGTLGSVTDNNDGTYTATLTSDTLVATATITGTLNSNAITDNATVEFTPGPASLERTLLVVSHDTILANGVTTSVVTIQLKDAYGNNLTTSGGTVTLAASLGTLGSVTDNGNGTYTATLTSSTTVGVSTITGKLNGNSITDTATVYFAPIPPPPPVVTGPADGSLIKDNTPLITGTSDPNDTIRVYVDGVLDTIIVADANGDWSYVSDTLADGPHDVRATATNEYGLTSEVSNINDFIIDSTKPAKPIVETPADSSIINDTTPIISGTSEPNDTVYVYVDGVLDTVVIADENGDWSYVSDDLAEGDHVVFARAVDEAGNVSEDSDVNFFTIDITPPGPPVVETPEDSSHINDSTPEIIGTADPNVTVEVYIDGVLDTIITSDGDGVWRYVHDGLLDGEHNVYAISVDDAGNRSEDSNVNTFTVDGTPPPPPVVINPPDGSSSYNRRPDITGTAEANTTVDVFLNSVHDTTITATPLGTWSYLSKKLNAGSYAAVATATDSAGNVSPQSNTNTFTVLLDSLEFLTFTPDLYAVKKPTSTKRAGGIGFRFRFINNSGLPAAALRVRFVGKVDTLLEHTYFPGYEKATKKLGGYPYGDPQSFPELENRLFDLVGDTVMPGETVYVAGISLRINDQTVNDHSWVLGDTVTDRVAGGKHGQPLEIRKIFPQPNAANVRDKVYALGYFPKKLGMFIGTPRTLEKNLYGWVALRRSADVQKSMIDKTGPHTGDPGPFDYNTDKKGKPFVGPKRSVQPKVHNNMLFAELTSLKLNIAASDLEVTPNGFGDLLYDSDNPMFDGLSIRQISALADTYMTVWQGVDTTIYDSLYATVYKFNRAFEGPIDTISFLTALKLRGQVPLYTVEYLHRDLVNPPTVRQPSPEDAEGEEVPESPTLAQNYPNPFNPSTTILFEVPEQALVTVKIYNMLGQEVALLLENHEIEAGEHELLFSPSTLPSGVYFYRLSAETMPEDEDVPSQKFVQTRKMLLIK